MADAEKTIATKLAALQNKRAQIDAKEAKMQAKLSGLKNTETTAPKTTTVRKSGRKR